MSLRAMSQVPAPKHYVLGGAHLTGSSFVPASLLKDLTATEYLGALNMSELMQMSLQDINNLQVNVTKSKIINTRYANMPKLTEIDSCSSLQLISTCEISLHI